MLRKLDLRLIFTKIKEAGYTSCQIYAERTNLLELEIYDKENRARHSESGGLSIELLRPNDDFPRVFRTNHFSTESVLKLLELPFSESEIKVQSMEPSTNSSMIGEKIRKLNLLVRKINLENSLSKPVFFWFQERRQIYEIAVSADEIKSGENEQGEFKVNVESSLKGKPLCFNTHFSTGMITELWKELDSLLPKIQRRIILGSTEQWPAPQGPIPVGWSATSMAKLIDCLIRGFEGDLVLKKFSYLSELEAPLNFNFSVQEKDNEASARVDHEGYLRRPILIFDGQKPKGLATDSRLASRFSVAPTGHSRRESFEDLSTISFWHPVLHSSNTVGSVIEEMKEGLWVEEVEILELDVILGRVTLRFCQVNLVHQGEVGESVEPFSWTLSLVDLMRTMTHFSKETQTVGLFHTKQKQRILTEYTISAALSSHLDIPGSVPKSHYWG